MASLCGGLSCLFMPDGLCCIACTPRVHIHHAACIISWMYCFNCSHASQIIMARDEQIQRLQELQDGIDSQKIFESTGLNVQVWHAALTVSC